MRKIIVFNLVSIDGYFAGINGDIDWHNVDDEFNKFGIEQTKSFGTILFGRTTYQLFENFWPKALADPATSPDNREIAKIIDDIEKIVFSTSLQSVMWKNSKLFREINKDQILKLKEEEGGNIVLFGSGTIVQQMTNLELIEEYRLMVNPVVLSAGQPLFKDLKHPLNLQLLETREFKNGNLLLTYIPAH